ncbi:MAG TPA: ABC transporter permease, partial [Acidimicrobiales bacterium]|nr:ABC transporter permease [Acidimicrobiales bacterium]
MTRRYAVRRLLEVLPAVLGIVSLSFVLVHAAPSDPALVFAGEGADQAQIDAARAYLGLDRPLPEQFTTYLGRLARGDLGTSFVHRRPVREVIGLRLPATLLLTGTALVASTLVGVALGLAAARRPHRAVDVSVRALSLALYSLPAFWLAQLAILALALKAGLLPASGMVDARGGHEGAAAAVDVARHLVLPALVLALSEVALLARVTRSGVLQESGRDYVRAARAKGLPGGRVIARHAL